MNFRQRLFVESLGLGACRAGLEPKHQGQQISTPEYAHIMLFKRLPRADVYPTTKLPVKDNETPSDGNNEKDMETSNFFVIYKTVSQEVCDDPALPNAKVVEFICVPCTVVRRFKR